MAMNVDAEGVVFTVEQALERAKLRGHDWPLDIDALRALAAEVERLRAENARFVAVAQDRDELIEQVAAMEAAATGTSLCKTWRELSGQDLYGEAFRDNMEAEDFDRLDAEIQDTGMELAKLREEAATARLALDVALKECAELRKAVNQQMDDFEPVEAKLKWFEERELLLRPAFDCAETTTAGEIVDDVERWEAENPPPGAAT